MTNASFTLAVQASGTGQLAAPGSVSGSALSSLRASNTVNASTSYTSGTGSGQVDNVVIIDRTLAASASETLNLFTLSGLANLTNEVAGFQTLRAVAVLPIANPDGTAAGTGVKVEPGATNATQLLTGGTSYLLNVRSGTSGFAIADSTGITVDATACNVKVSNLDGALKSSYRLVLSGRAV